MDSTPLHSPLTSSVLTKPLNPLKSNSTNIRFSLLKIISSRQTLRCMFCVPSRKANQGSFSRSCLTIDEPSLAQSSSVSLRVQSLDFEFKSLREPIERVKRLLHYAILLPPFDESWRVQENRVTGCTAQVWLEVKMDQNGLMRFRVDSDSEITKGFCSCLILVFEGAEAEEVLSVKKEDLIEMNVGLQSRGNSRVNIWHYVLFGMQNRTRDLVQERERNEQCQPLEAFSSLFVANGSCKETQGQVKHLSKLVT